MNIGEILDLKSKLKEGTEVTVRLKLMNHKSPDYEGDKTWFIDSIGNICVGVWDGESYMNEVSCAWIKPEQIVEFHVEEDTQD